MVGIVLVSHSKEIADGTGADGRITVKDVVRSAPQKRPPQDRPPVTSAITGANANRTRRLRMLKRHPFWVTSVAFSPDSRLLASGSTNSVRL
jgi:WD40 repeat protein